MYSTNEWDPLKKVIVGVADNAKIPPVDISLRTVNYADELDEANIPVGPYPQQVIDEANEDLDGLAKFLQGEGVEVVRPHRTDCAYYNYCPRDTVFLHGDLALASPSPLRARKNEWLAFGHHLPSVVVTQHTLADDLYNDRCVGDPNVLALNETEPAFDAANIIRANEDVLYLVSNSGNKLGAELLQQQLGDNAKVHLLEGVYSYMHIDSTVVFLREGLMLLNPSRIKDKNVLPEPFCNWDAIWCPDPGDIKHYPGYCNSSKWVDMNLFSVNDSLITINEHQDSLRKELEKYNIDSAVLPMRHRRTLGGGFHCVTLDLKRHVE